MRTILTASKDTTLYQAFKNNNAGLDEILEIGKLVNTELVEPSYASASVRTLLYFNLPTTESVHATSSYFLNLKLANASEVSRNQQILVYPISQSWDEGSGYFYQNIKNVRDGATWSVLNANTSWSLAGGDFLTSSNSASVTLSTYPLQDLRIDVTNIIRPFVSQSTQNTFYGLIVKFPTADEIDPYNKGNIKVFSVQTHTIHAPTLEVVWNSQTFTTGSLKPIPSTLDIKVVASNIQSEYAKGDIARIEFVVRDPYPLRSFDSVLRYKNKYYLPTSSYYSIVDVQSNTTVIPFDEYSKLDCNSSGSYLTLDTTPLYQKRYYAIKLKIVSGSLTKTIDPGLQFSIL